MDGCMAVSVVFNYDVSLKNEKDTELVEPIPLNKTLTLDKNVLPKHSISAVSTLEENAISFSIFTELVLFKI